MAYIYISHIHLTCTLDHSGILDDPNIILGLTPFFLFFFFFSVQVLKGLNGLQKDKNKAHVLGMLMSEWLGKAICT